MPSARRSGDQGIHNHMPMFRILHAHAMRMPEQVARSARLPGAIFARLCMPPNPDGWPLWAHRRRAPTAISRLLDHSVASAADVPQSMHAQLRGPWHGHAHVRPRCMAVLAAVPSLESCCARAQVVRTLKMWPKLPPSPFANGTTHRNPTADTDDGKPPTPRPSPFPPPPSPNSSSPASIEPPGSLAMLRAYAACARVPPAPITSAEAAVSGGLAGAQLERVQSCMPR